MTEENITFVRDVHQNAVTLIATASTSLTPIDDFFRLALQEAHHKLRLLSLLIESEAMREKAEFEAEHYWVNNAPTDQCFGCGGEMCNDPRAQRPDSDWQKAVRERWLLK